MKWYDRLLLYAALLAGIMGLCLAGCDTVTQQQRYPADGGEVPFALVTNMDGTVTTNWIRFGP